ncbi:hypothetical protein X943_003555 [Babesia divergens]|uniref:t-SNARE coiled-coil homology domain-containing protein n=1 Tax=Babesia divergens TaxID=32595 RepID=A0AAD9G9L8_BABDI|nr:hypothetical protein X943_003555 [Babesia divergens]
MITNKYNPPSFGASNLKYEKLISANLKHIRAELLYTEHNVGDLSSRFASQKLVETIQNKLDNVFALISVTEGYLDEWESEITHSPGVQYTGGAFDKLKGQFSREVARAKQVSTMVKNRPPLPSSESCDETSTVDTNQGASVVDYNFINDAKLEFDCDDRMIQHFDAPEYVGEDQLLTDSLIETRNQGIHNIRSQIEQARDIFKDIATIVSVQDGGLQQLETNLKDACKTSEEAMLDIESLTLSRRRASRKR